MSFAWSVRELTGFGLWIEQITGWPTQGAAEDTRAAEGQHWSIGEGQELSRVVHARRHSLITRAVIRLTIDALTEFGYRLIVGTTPVHVMVLNTDTATELPARVAAAWDFAGFALGTDGTNGLVLTPLDDTTYEIVGPLELGGVPAITLGYGWEYVGHDQTAEIYEVVVTDIRHSLFITAWGQVRGRGVSRRMVSKLGDAANSAISAELLVRRTGQGIETFTHTPISPDTSTGFGGGEENQDVSQVELITTGYHVSVMLDPSIESITPEIIQVPDNPSPIPPDENPDP